MQTFKPDVMCYQVHENIFFHDFIFQNMLKDNLYHCMHAYLNKYVHMSNNIKEGEHLSLFTRN